MVRRGLRCLFGDQTLFCRAADFRRVGGYDGWLPLMEDLDLIIRLHMAGKRSSFYRGSLGVSPASVFRGVSTLATCLGSCRRVSSFL